jgi:hypothetical protein
MYGAFGWCLQLFLRRPSVRALQVVCLQTGLPGQFFHISLRIRGKTGIQEGLFALCRLRLARLRLPASKEAGILKDYLIDEQDGIEV